MNDIYTDIVEMAERVKLTNTLRMFFDLFGGDWDNGDVLYFNHTDRDNMICKYAIQPLIDNDRIIFHPHTPIGKVVVVNPKSLINVWGYCKYYRTG